MLAPLVALVVLACGASACSSGVEEDAGDGEMTSEALTRACTGGDFLYRAKKEAPTSTVPARSSLFYRSLDDLTNRRPAPDRISTQAVVKRTGLVESKGERFTKVLVLTGTHRNQGGWIATNALEPVNDGCAAAEDQGAAVVERIAFRGESLPAELAESTLQCVVGLVDGLGGGGSALVQGIVHLVAGAGKAIREVLTRDRDIILMSLGHADAYQRLLKAGASDHERLVAAGALIGHAIPAIHQYLSNQSMQYRLLDSPHQSKFLCQVIGRATFEVVVAIATAGTGKAVQATDVSKSILSADLVQGAGAAASRVPMQATEAESRLALSTLEALETAEIPSRIGSTDLYDVGKALAFLERDRWWAGGNPTAWSARALVTSVETLHAELLNATSLSERLRILNALNESLNPASKLGLAAEGNCSFAARALMTLLTGGHAICAMKAPYEIGEKSDLFKALDAKAYAEWEQRYQRGEASFDSRSKGYFTSQQTYPFEYLPYMPNQKGTIGVGYKCSLPNASEAWEHSLTDVAEAHKEYILQFAAASLPEGGIGILSSKAESATRYYGHQILVVKMNGKLIQVNNQGWEHSVQELKDWFPQWETWSSPVRNVERGYAFYATDQVIPFAKH